nr:MAG: glycosyl transferase family 2 [Pseudomonadota bacterium]
MLMKLSGSLVLYNNPSTVYEAAVESFLRATRDSVLIVVDNSPVPLKSPVFSHHRVHYVFAGKNLGFGAGHNRAIELAGDSKFHLVMNPDVRFGAEVLDRLCELMETCGDIGAVMPRIVYPNGTDQHLCKLLPTPADLILRRFAVFDAVREWINGRYELSALPQDEPQDVPTVSGCFLMVRTELVRRLGGFDERYFMYMEDVDLVRRIGDTHRVVYDPTVSVVHGYGRGSYTNLKLLFYHVRSAIKYFCKWGWVIDKERARRNKVVLRRLREGRSPGRRQQPSEALRLRQWR